MITDDGNGERADAYRLLADLFSHPPDGGELDTIRDDLELKSRETEFAIFEDFNHLFPFPGGATPPLESLNETAGRDTVVDRLTDMYAEAGLTFDDEYQLVPDHISIEFLFMSYLVDTGDLERQQRFLEEYIMNWVPFYCDRVMAEARTVYYREIASMTRQFLDQEYEGFA